MPAPVTDDAILEALRAAGPSGVPVVELWLLGTHVHDAVERLRQRGYSIVQEQKFQHPTHGKTWGWTLVAEPGGSLHGAAADAVLNDGAARRRGKKKTRA